MYIYKYIDCVTEYVKTSKMNIKHILNTHTKKVLFVLFLTICLCLKKKYVGCIVFIYRKNKQNVTNLKISILAGSNKP